MLEVVPADDVTFASFYSGWRINGRWIGYAAMKGRLIASMGGLIELRDGEWVAFLDIERARNPLLVRYMVRGIKDAKAMGAKVIKTTCDTSIPRSEALLRRFGFEPTNQLHDGKEIWECRVSR